jgi:hypothetical protein
MTHSLPPNEMALAPYITAGNFVSSSSHFSPSKNSTTDPSFPPMRNTLSVCSLRVSKESDAPVCLAPPSQVMQAIWEQHETNHRGHLDAQQRRPQSVPAECTVRRCLLLICTRRSVFSDAWILRAADCYHCHYFSRLDILIGGGSSFGMGGKMAAVFESKSTSILFAPAVTVDPPGHLVHWVD